jgi:methylenetetrahydrofolate reductase (NADPH)
MALGQPSRLRRPENITRSIPRMLAAQRRSISFEFFPR